MSYRWDFKQIKHNRERTKRKPIKAFKGGTIRKFKSIAHACYIFNVSRSTMVNAANRNLEINGYEIEWD